MEEPKDNKQSPIVEIAKDGDVILVAGPEKMKLRVHSLFLKTASEPFSAMFEPVWNEGHKLSERDGPVEVSLPEDNAAALKIVCDVIHHRNQMVPQTVAAEDVLLIAVTADKWDCIEALRFASEEWLHPRNDHARELLCLTAAAYLFQNAPAFKKITKALILNHDASFLALSCQGIESAMPWRVLCLLEDQRSHARLELAEIILAGINDVSGRCIHKCGWTSKYAYAYLKSLEEQRLWPGGLLCISDAIERLERMPSPIPEEESAKCAFGSKHTAPKYKKNRREELDDFNSGIGLCMHCVRSGSADSSHCSTKH